MHCPIIDPLHYGWAVYSSIRYGRAVGNRSRAHKQFGSICGGSREQIKLLKKVIMLFPLAEIHNTHMHHALIVCDALPAYYTYVCMQIRFSTPMIQFINIVWFSRLLVLCINIRFVFALSSPSPCLWCWIASVLYCGPNILGESTNIKGNTMKLPWI